jgi:hypothetical protein
VLQRGHVFSILPFQERAMTNCPFTRSRTEDAIVTLCMGFAVAMVVAPSVFVFSHHEALFSSGQAQTP